MFHRYLHLLDDDDDDEMWRLENRDDGLVLPKLWWMSTTFRFVHIGAYSIVYFGMEPAFLAAIANS